MSWTHIQHAKGGTASAATSATATFGAGTTAGNLLVAHISQSNNANSATDTFTMPANWVAVAPINRSAAGSKSIDQMFYYANNVGGITSVVGSSPTSAAITLEIWEFHSSVTNSPTIDGTANEQNQQSNSTSLASTTESATAGDLAVYGASELNSASTLTGDAGWTNQSTNSASTGLFHSSISGYKLNVTSGVQTATTTSTNTGNWMSTGVVFVEGAGGGGGGTTAGRVPSVIGIPTLPTIGHSH